MTITINGNTATAVTAFILPDVVEITANMTFADALQYEGATFVIDGETFKTAGIKAVSFVEDGVVCADYFLKDDTEDMMEEYDKMDSALGKIRTAVKALGTGVPTLTKLIAFLDAVKAAINYE